MPKERVNFFFDSPEFCQWYSETQLKESLNVSFEESGWYSLENGDFALIIERNGKFKAWIWVGIDPRDEFEKVLDLPFFNRNN